MPLKRGGGNHMQLYDSRNGEYTEQEKQYMRAYDDSAMASYELCGQNALRKFHFPVEGVHEEKYCNRFIQAIIDDVKQPTYVFEKMNYLLTFHVKNDKSMFLKNLGYSEYKPYELFYDICVNTKRTSLRFSHFAASKLIIEGETILKGKVVKTAWRLENDLNLFFVTLIPGGHRK